MYAFFAMVKVLGIETIVSLGGLVSLASCYMLVQVMYHEK